MHALLDDAQKGERNAMPAQHNGNRPNHTPDGVPRLTRRQLALVYELAEGYDIATAAEHRGRGLSATYELAERVCERLGLSQWQEIGPYAVTHGMAGGSSNGAN